MSISQKNKSSVIVNEVLSLDEVSQRANRDDQNDDIYSDTFESESGEDDEGGLHGILQQPIATSDTQAKKLYDKYGAMHRSPYSDEEETPIQDKNQETIRYTAAASSLRLSNHLVSPPYMPTLTHSDNLSSPEERKDTRALYSDEDDSSVNESPNRKVAPGGTYTVDELSGSSDEDVEDNVLSRHSGAAHVRSGSNDSLEYSNDTNQIFPTDLTTSTRLKSKSSDTTAVSRGLPITPQAHMEGLGDGFESSAWSNSTSSSVPVSSPHTMEMQWYAAMLRDDRSLLSPLVGGSVVENTLTQSALHSKTPLKVPHFDDATDSSSIHSADHCMIQSPPISNRIGRSVSESCLDLNDMSLPRPSPSSHSSKASPFANGKSKLSSKASPSQALSPELFISSTPSKPTLNVSTERELTPSSDSSEYETPLARPPRARTTSAGSASTPSVSGNVEKAPPIALFQSPPPGKSPHTGSMLHRAALVNASKKASYASNTSPVGSNYGTPPSSTRLPQPSSGVFFPLNDFETDSLSASTQDPQGQSIGDEGLCTAGTSTGTSPIELLHPWVEYMSEEGWPYFYNEVTGESTWERPDGYKASSSEGIVQHGVDSSGRGYEDTYCEKDEYESNIYGGDTYNTVNTYSEEKTHLEIGDAFDAADREGSSIRYDNYGGDGEYKREASEEDVAKRHNYSDSGRVVVRSENPYAQQQHQHPSHWQYQEKKNLEDTQIQSIDTVSSHDDDNSSKLSSCTSDGQVGGDGGSVASASLSNSMIDVKNKSGQSVLHISASACNVDALALLLSTGADVNDIDGQNLTPLQIICLLRPSSAQTECISMLIRHGADLNRIDSYGNSILHNVLLWGIGGNLLSVVSLSGATALQNMSKSELDELRAAQLASLEVIATQPGIDINIANNDGDQPLHVATKLGLVSCMQVILKAIAMHSNIGATTGHAHHGKHLKRSHSNSAHGHSDTHVESASRQFTKQKSHHSLTTLSHSTSPTKDSSLFGELADSNCQDADATTRTMTRHASGASSASASLAAVPSIAQSVNYYSTSEDERNAAATTLSRRHTKHGKSPKNGKSVKSNRSGHTNSTGNKSVGGLTIDTNFPAAEDNTRHFYDISDDSSGDDQPLMPKPRALADSIMREVDDASKLVADSVEEYVIEEYSHLGVLRDGWIEYCTEDGDKYYYNSDSGHVQWKHPFQAELEKRAAIIAKLPPQVAETNETMVLGDVSELSDAHYDSQEDAKRVHTSSNTTTSISNKHSAGQSGDEGIKNKLREKYKQYTTSLATPSQSAQQSSSDVITSASKAPHGMSTRNVEVVPSKSSSQRSNAASSYSSTHANFGGSGSMRTMSVSVNSHEESRSGTKNPATSTASSYYQYSHSIASNGAGTENAITNSMQGSKTARSVARRRSRDHTAEYTSPPDNVPNEPALAAESYQPYEPEQYSTPSKHRDNLPRNPSISSLSGESEASKERHLEIWSRFFENAMIASSSREELTEIRRKASKKGVSVGGFTPVTVRKKSGLQDTWNIPPATAEYQNTVSRALAMKAKQDAEVSKGKITSPKQSDKIAADGNWAVLAAAMRGDVGTAEELLLSGFNPSCVDDHIRSPLHYACRAGDTAMVALLNDYGSDVDATDANGQTPLHVACEFGRSDVVQCLLQCAASVDVADNFGNTPLHIVGSSGSVECCQILLEYGAAVDATNTSGRTPLDVAVNRLSSHQGSTPALGVRKVIAMLSTASPSFNDTYIGGKQGREALMNSTVDEEYSLPSESIGETGSVTYGSDDSASVGYIGGGRGPTKAQGKYQGRKQSRARNSDGVSVSSMDSESKVRDLKRRARMNRGAESSETASLDKGVSNKHPSKIASSQTSVSSGGSDRRGDNKKLDRRSYDPSDLIYAEDKREEWIERGRSSVSASRYQEHEPEFDGYPPEVLSDDLYRPSPKSHTSPTHSSLYNHSNQTQYAFTPNDAAPSRFDSGDDRDDERLSSDSLSPPSHSSGTGGGNVVTNVMWGAASLLGATFKMFTSAPAPAPVEEPFVSPQLLAPPTDSELLTRGLGFHFDPDTVPQSPRPPAIVMDDIRRHEEAYRSGLTPRGQGRPTAPDEVLVAVEMARAAERHRRTPRSDRLAIKERRNLMSTIPDASRPAALKLPGNDDGRSSMQQQPPGGNKKNGYSVGPTLPSGVSWRYVDVLNEKNIGR